MKKNLEENKRKQSNLTSTHRTRFFFGKYLSVVDADPSFGLECIKVVEIFCATPCQKLYVSGKTKEEKKEEIKRGVREGDQGGEIFCW